MTGLLAGMLMVSGASAHAESAVKASLNGDVKSFFVSTILYDNALFESVGLTFGAGRPGHPGWAHQGLGVLTEPFGCWRTSPHRDEGASVLHGQTGGVQSPQFVDLIFDGVDDAEDPNAMTLTGGSIA